MISDKAATVINVWKKISALKDETISILKGEISRLDNETERLGKIVKSLEKDNEEYHRLKAVQCFYVNNTEGLDNLNTEDFVTGTITPVSREKIIDHKLDPLTLYRGLKSSPSENEDLHQKLLRTESDLTHSRSFARDLSRELEAIKRELSQTKIALTREQKKNRKKQNISIEESIRRRKIILIGKAITKMNRWQRIWWAITGRHEYMTFKYWESGK